MNESEMSYEEWYASRPESVKRLADKYPPDTKLKVKGVDHWVIGFTDGEHANLILSPIDPKVDYDEAHAQRIYVCAHHFEEKH